MKRTERKTTDSKEKQKHKITKTKTKKDNFKLDRKK